MSNLPDWAKGLVSDDIGWIKVKDCIIADQGIFCFEIFDIGYKSVLVLSDAANNNAPPMIFDFPSPKAAIQAAEGFIRGLRS